MAVTGFSVVPLTDEEGRDGADARQDYLQRAVPVKSTDRAVVLLEAIAAAAEGMSFEECAVALGFPRSSLHNILVTLERRGWLLRRVLPGRRRAAARYTVPDLLRNGILALPLPTPPVTAGRPKTGR